MIFSLAGMTFSLFPRTDHGFARNRDDKVVHTGLPPLGIDRAAPLRHSINAVLVYLWVSSFGIDAWWVKGHMC